MHEFDPNSLAASTVEALAQRVKFHAHFLKKKFGLRPIAAHDALARAARFESWQRMSAACQWVIANINAEGEAALQKRLALLEAMPLLIEIERGRAPDELQASALIAFAERVATELAVPRADVLDAFARAQHAPSWASLMAGGAAAAVDLQPQPLYSVNKFGPRLQIVSTPAEQALVESIGTLDSARAGELAERLQHLVAKRPDFLRGMAILGAALDELRDPACLQWYASAREGVAALITQRIGRVVGLAAQLPWDIPENRWALNAARREAWALARYHQDFAGAVRLTIGIQGMDPMDLFNIVPDQLAFACANGSWEFPHRIAVKKHDLACSFMSGLFGLLRSTAYGSARLEPNALAQVLHAWVTTDWTHAALTGPTDRLEEMDGHTPIGSCVKLVREQRAAEFDVAVAKMMAIPGLRAGVDALIRKRQASETSTQFPRPSLNDWGRECRAFFAEMTGLPESAL